MLSIKKKGFKGIESLNYTFLQTKFVFPSHLRNEVDRAEKFGLHDIATKGPVWDNFHKTTNNDHAMLSLVTGAGTGHFCTCFLISLYKIVLTLRNTEESRRYISEEGV